MTTVLQPMTRSGLTAEPARPMMGMKRAYEPKMVVMFINRGKVKERQCTATHFQSEIRQIIP